MYALLSKIHPTPPIFQIIFGIPAKAFRFFTPSPFTQFANIMYLCRLNLIHMKKFILLLLVFIGISSCSMAADPATVVAPTTNAVNNYLLYPTTNFYTFLKLDTRNGKIWQVQYSMDENEFEVVLNSRELVTAGKPGQFALYPTTNNWTFLLLDTVNGDVWHVQWSQDPDKRGLFKIQSLY